MTSRFTKNYLNPINVSLLRVINLKITSRHILSPEKGPSPLLKISLLGYSREPMGHRTQGSDYQLPEVSLWPVKREERLLVSLVRETCFLPSVWNGFK